MRPYHYFLHIILNYIYNNKDMENTNKKYYELRTHGSFDLPIALYEGTSIETNSVYIHHHDELEIIYIVKGKCKVKINGKDIIGNDGCFIFVPRNALHYIEDLGTKNHLCYCTLVYSPSFLNLAENTFVKKSIVGPIISGTKVVKYKISPDNAGYNEIRTQYLKAVNDFKETKNALLLISDFYLFYYLLDKFNYFFVGKKSKLSDEVKVILSYIQEHYEENISIKELAEMTNYSESYLMHKFKKHIDCSIVQYILNLRLEKAEEMLMLTDFSIDDISYKTGFFDTSYFIKKFKQKYKLTPLQFRNKSN